MSAMFFSRTKGYLLDLRTMSVWTWLTPGIWPSAVSNSSTSPDWSSGNLTCTRSATRPNATGSSPYPEMDESLGSFNSISCFRGVKSVTMSSGKIL